MPASSLRFVGRNASGTLKPVNAVRSPNQANGTWNQSSTPRSSSHRLSRRTASRSVTPGSRPAAIASAPS